MYECQPRFIVPLFNFVSLLLISEMNLKALENYRGKSWKKIDQIFSKTLTFSLNNFCLLWKQGNLNKYWHTVKKKHTKPYNLY